MSGRSEQLWKTHFISILLHTLALFAGGRLRKKGISLVSRSSVAQTSTKDAQEQWPQNTTASTDRMTSILELNHCVTLLKGFSNSSLDTDSIQIHQKDFLLGFFLCFLHFLFQFLLDFLFRKDREHFQNSICSLETEQTKSKARKALAGPYRNYPRSQLPLQLDSRAVHYLHGRPKSCLFGLWQE